jgi:hypothetical protein
MLLVLNQFEMLIATLTKKQQRGALPKKWRTAMHDNKPYSLVPGAESLHAVAVGRGWSFQTSCLISLQFKSHFISKLIVEPH